MQTARSMLQGRICQQWPPRICRVRHYIPITHSTVVHIDNQTSAAPKNPILFNYLVHSFNFPESRALIISNRFSRIKTLDKPQSIVQYFKSLGFSDTQIQSSVKHFPQVLFTDVENTLKPKLQFFQDLGLSGSDLGKFISKGSWILSRSLAHRLKPCIDIVKDVLADGCNSKINEKYTTNNNGGLVQVMSRWPPSWILCKDPNKRLTANISYMRSCGVVGSQLAKLLILRPRIFIMKEADVKSLVSKVVNMGFSCHSRMFFHAIYAFTSISSETFVKKLNLFKSFGFSEMECMKMIKSFPLLFVPSQDKLRLGLQLYLGVIGLKRSELVTQPKCFSFSIQHRVVPRYRIFQIVRSKRILKKEPSVLPVIYMPEKAFLEKYILRFPDHAEELMVAYKGHSLESVES